MSQRGVAGPELKAIFKDMSGLPATVEDGNDVQGLCIRSVDNEVRISGGELHRFRG